MFKLNFYFYDLNCFVILEFGKLNKVGIFVNRTNKLQCNFFSR